MPLKRRMSKREEMQERSMRAIEGLAEKADALLSPKIPEYPKMEIAKYHQRQSENVQEIVARLLAAIEDEPINDVGTAMQVVQTLVQSQYGYGPVAGQFIR